MSLSMHGSRRPLQRSAKRSTKYNDAYRINGKIHLWWDESSNLSRHFRLTVKKTK